MKALPYGYTPCALVSSIIEQKKTAWTPAEKTSKLRSLNKSLHSAWRDASGN